MYALLCLCAFNNASSYFEMKHPFGQLTPSIDCEFSTHAEALPHLKLGTVRPVSYNEGIDVDHLCRHHLARSVHGRLMITFMSHLLAACDPGLTPQTSMIMVYISALRRISCERRFTTQSKCAAPSRAVAIALFAVTPEIVFDGRRRFIWRHSNRTRLIAYQPRHACAEILAILILRILILRIEHGFGALHR